MTLEEFTRPEPAAEFDEDAYAYAAAHILECVAGERGMREQIKRKTFDDAFLDYERRHGDIFRRLDEAYRSAPEPDRLIAELVQHFLDEMAAAWAKEPQRKRTVAREDDKITIAIFLSPMVYHLDLACSAPFCRQLNDEWLRRYPKTPYYLGSYEELSNGFRKKFLGLCFITTAVCEAEGKPDDCAELTAFRAFRDGYLAACPDGPALIEEYYETAPDIVTMIGVCSNPAESYREIRSRWLDGCYRDLQAGRMEDCKARYIDMVRTLERRYLQ